MTNRSAERRPIAARRFALSLWPKLATGADLALVRERLNEDRLIYILFPEGTRSRTGDISRFRPGVGALVAAGTVPVVPCLLPGAHEAWPPHRRTPRRARVRLTIGPPLTFEDAPNDRADWMRAAEECERAVRRLGSEKPA